MPMYMQNTPHRRRRVCFEDQFGARSTNARMIETIASLNSGESFGPLATMEVNPCPSVPSFSRSHRSSEFHTLRPLEAQSLFGTLRNQVAFDLRSHRKGHRDDFTLDALV